MKILALLALAGFGAQLVDGSLGMAYGTTSTTLLLAIGANPAAASATVHMAEIGTTLISGLAHWKFGNVDWTVVVRVGVPGAVGAFAGATVLSSLSTEVAAPAMAMLLLFLGVYLLARFSLRGMDRSLVGRPMRRRFLGPLGLVAGFVDATGGGGWGPLGTPALLACGRMEPRKVIGSIDASEFLVALAASLGFFVGLSDDGIDTDWVLALLVGGMIAAPIAAWLVRHVPPRLLGSLVGGLIILTNARTLMSGEWIHVPDAFRYSAYVVICIAWIGGITWSWTQYRRDCARQYAGAGAAAVKRTVAGSNHLSPDVAAAKEMPPLDGGCISEEASDSGSKTDPIGSPNVPVSQDVDPAMRKLPPYREIRSARFPMGLPDRCDETVLEAFADAWLLIEHSFSGARLTGLAPDYESARRWLLRTSPPLSCEELDGAWLRPIDPK